MSFLTEDLVPKQDWVATFRTSSALDTINIVYTSKVVWPYTVQTILPAAPRLIIRQDVLVPLTLNWLLL